MKSSQRKGFYTGKVFLVFLLCLLLGSTGCADRPAEGLQEISGTMSIAGADMEAGARQSLKQNNEDAQGADQNQNNEDAQGADWNRNGVQKELEIHFLDVGQGDCTLLVCGEEAMLIDAGDNDQGTNIQNYLQKHNVETLKYVICTHPDADHIGGMDVILYKFSCETVLMTDEEKDTETYRDVIDTVEAKGYKAVVPAVGQQYSLGDAEFVIVGPGSETGREGNNNSIAVLVTHGENRFLFTGDAEEEEEAEMLQGTISLAADVYKVGHHGSRTSSSEAFLEAVKPAYAVISCGEGNSYGHPHAETLNNLRAMGVKVYRTDEQGSIILTSDGQDFTWNCSPSETWISGEPTGSSKEPQAEDTSPGITEQESGEISYICNINTMKFHYPDCSSVDQMKESNKLPVSASREELISQGYDPCKRCKP